MKIYPLLIYTIFLFSCANNKTETVATAPATWYDFSKTDSLKNIYGEWQDVDDSLAFMTFKDSIATMGYKGEEPNTTSYKTNYIFDVERDIDKLILVDKTLDTLAYGVVFVTVDTLYLIYLDRGNSLIYKRIKP